MALTLVIFAGSELFTGNAMVLTVGALTRRSSWMQLASVWATLAAFFPAGGKPFGWQDPAQWTRYGAWMLDNELVKNPPDAGRALTNEFLAGQGI